MLTYHFNISDETGSFEDSEGCDLPSVAAVQSEAIRGAREIIAERLRRRDAIHPETILKVTDHVGRIVHRVTLDDILLGAAVGR